MGVKLPETPAIVPPHADRHATGDCRRDGCAAMSLLILLAMLWSHPFSDWDCRHGGPGDLRTARAVLAIRVRECFRPGGALYGTRFLAGSPPVRIGLEARLVVRETRRGADRGEEGGGLRVEGTCPQALRG